MKPALIALLLLIVCSVGVAAGNLREEWPEFEQALERTRMLTEKCVPEQVHLQSGEIHVVNFLGRREPGTELNVVIKKDQNPAHLIFYTDQEVVWRLFIEPGASVETIYTVGPVPSAVYDVPKETLVYSIGYDENDQPSDNCMPTDPDALELAKALLHYDWLPAHHIALEEALNRYAHQEVVFRVLIEPDSNSGIVSYTSSGKSLRTRMAGEAVLRYARLPSKETSLEETLAMPKGLSTKGVHDWLLQSGAADTADEDVLELMCLREQAAYWAVGITNLSVRSWCNAQAWWERSSHLILSKPIDIGEVYICDYDDYPTVNLYVPDQIEFGGIFVNCSMPVIKFDEDE